MMRALMNLLLSACLVALSCNHFSTAGEESPNLQPTTQNKEQSHISTEVELIQFRSSGNRLRFRFKNGLGKAIFLSYSKESYDDERSLCMAYYLECKDVSGGKYIPYSPNFDSVPALLALSPGVDIVFNIPKPNVKGNCEISVSYYSDENAARLVNEKLQELSQNEEEYLDRSHEAVELEFEIE